MNTVKLTIAMALLSTFALTACNTVEGAGEDIQAGGQAIERSANQHK